MARGRSVTAHRKVLDAALELVAENGVDATSMDAIAGRSGVSKATIYKHWADKQQLLLEMMAEVNGLRTRPKFNTGHTKADIIAVLSYKPEGNSELRERMMPHIVAYGTKDKEFGNAWRNTVMEPPRREIRELIQAGVARGELLPDLDMDVALAVLLGPMLYWHVFLRTTMVDPQRMVAGVVDAFWRAFSIPKKTPAKR